MNVKRALILTPLILVALLLQSYFWVPSYEKQSVGNPARLRTYIEGSIADAKILNPILNADGASSRITDFVFDGLLDMDENLNLRGRLGNGLVDYRKSLSACPARDDTARRESGDRGAAACGPLPGADERQPAGAGRPAPFSPASAGHRKN